MALLGKTKIELTDVHTGRVETVEKSNFITNAVAAYNKPLGGLTDAYGLLYGARISDFYGGLCLFDKALEGDKNTFFPLGGATQVGAAEYGVTNTTADSWLGSYNTNESSIDKNAHSATFVYDFTTAQANGNIGAVCLAPVGCGTGGVWGIHSGMTYTRPDVTHIKSNDVQGHGVYVNPYTAQYNASTSRIVPICWDIEHDVGYYLNVTASPCKLEKRRLYLKTASLFHDQRTTNTTLSQSVVLPFDVSCSLYTPGCDQYDATHFCVFGYKETGGEYVGTIYCFVFGYDGTRFKTIAVASPCAKTRVKDMTVAYLKGYLLLAGNATEADGTVPVYRVPENNPTDIQAAQIGQLPQNSPRCFKFSMGEIYYCGNGSYDSAGSYNMMAYNVITNKITRTNALAAFVVNSRYYEDAQYKQVPILDSPFLFLHQSRDEGFRTTVNEGWLYRVRMFLSTINNLSEPVTKTADKTMKITYTLTEVAGGGAAG